MKPLIAFSVLAFATATSNVWPQAHVNDFVDFSMAGLPGKLFVPPEANESARPVILFLHGAGETGSNNLSQINGNITNLVNAAKERGAYLYAPQATSVVGGIYNWNDMERTDNVMSMMDQLSTQENVDVSRIYVTGLSMGGGGTWSMASRYSDRQVPGLRRIRLQPTR